MLTVKPMNQLDLMDITPHDYAADGLEAILVALENSTAERVLDDSYTAYYDKRIVMCGGFIETRQGVASCWAIIDKDIYGSSMLWAHRVTVEKIDNALEDRFHRLEMTVNTDFPQGSKWAKMLGFEFEGLLKKYDPWGNDHIMYARTR